MQRCAATQYMVHSEQAAEINNNCPQLMAGLRGAVRPDKHYHISLTPNCRLVSPCSEWCTLLSPAGGETQTNLWCDGPTAAQQPRTNIN